jgi:hypothetical protein
MGSVRVLDVEDEDVKDESGRTLVFELPLCSHPSGNLLIPVPDESRLALRR